MNKRIEHEIAHGKKISNQAESVWGWDTPTGLVRARRRGTYFIELGKIDKSKKVLELGCGTGLFTKMVFDSTHAEIVAIDISNELIEQASAKLPQLKFKVGNAMELHFEDNSFDCVFGSSVLHHLDFDKALDEAYRVLNKNGRLVFAEPNMLNPQIFIQKNIPVIKKWAGDSPDETAIIRWSLADLLRKKGFKNIKIVPYDFLHPLTPGFLIPLVSFISKVLERIPLVREISGSVIISAEK